MRKNFSLLAIYKIAWPAIIAHATVMFVSIIDLTFIAKLPTAAIAIAAAALANNICAGVYSALEGIRSGTAVLIARYHGSDEQKKISQTLTLALAAALLMGVTLLLISPLISFLTYRWPNTKYMANLGRSYLAIRLIGLPFHLTILAIIGIFRGLKNTVIPFTITMIICAVDIFLNYGLMPRFGMDGIAVATAVAYILGAAASFVFLIKHPLTKSYVNFKDSFQPVFKTFVRLCTEIGLYAGSLIIAFTVFIGMFARLGHIQFTAHQIAFQIYLATYLPPMGFFVAASVLLGKVLGEKREEMAFPVIRKVALASIPIVGGISLFVALSAHKIAAFLSAQNPVIIKLAIPSIYLVCVTQTISAFYLILKGALTAAKDTRFVFFAGTLSSFIFFLPASYILGFKLGYGVWGAYFAFLLWTLVDVTIFSIRFFVQKPWKYHRF